MIKARFLLIPAVLILLLASGCASLFNSLVTEVSEAPVVKSSSDPLDGYVFAYMENYPGGYVVARIVTPASPSTKNQAEILDMNQSGSKRWAQVFTSHPALESELAIGEPVLFQSSGFGDPSKETLTSTIWDAYYITDTSDLFKGKVTLRGDMVVSTKYLRIPDTEIETN